MARRSSKPGRDAPPAGPAADPDGPLTHSPFAELAKQVRTGHEQVREDQEFDAVRPESSSGEQGQGKLILREERSGPHGGPVTRISGIPGDRFRELAGQLRRDLGCRAWKQGPDLLLQGALRERAARWFAGQGSPVRHRQVPRAASPRGSTEAASRQRKEPTSMFARGEPEGPATRRSAIARGCPVAVVQKAHQATGQLTEGVVREVLTSAGTHSRGIKVRLESGVVGRVHRLLRR